MNMSIDQDANPLKPHAQLAHKRSCFADVLSFDKNNPPKDLRHRVGKYGHNPLFEEIEYRLRNPESRQHSLATSLAIRSSNPNNEKWHTVVKRPKMCKDKTINIALKDIYKTVRAQQSVPPVPLHRMDKVTRNFTESLLEETAAERIKMSEWKK